MDDKRKYRRRRNPSYLTVREISDRYQFHPNTVYSWLKQELLPYATGSKGEYLIRIDDLEAFFEEYYD